MSEETTTVITEELRKKAMQKPTFNVMFVDGGESRLSLFRGEVMIRNFCTFYSRYANISYLSTTAQQASKLTLSNLGDINIIWVDSSVDMNLAQSINKLQVEIMDSINPNWKKELSDLKAEGNEEKILEYTKELKSKREEKLHVVYSIEEFIWEAPVGRAYPLQLTMAVENFISVADIIVVPTHELKEAIQHFGFANKYVDFVVIPTAVSHEFFPLFKDFKREMMMNASASPKAKILIKGIEVPANVQAFIQSRYKEYDITISSVGEFNDSIMALIGRKKVRHLVHWANPSSNKRNFSTTYALERDCEFDFIIYCVPDNLADNMYEITKGDEDILFAISSGSLPICGVDHVGYDPTSIYNASGLTFGKDSKEDDIHKIVKNHYYNHLKFNEAYGKCRVIVENRLISSPSIMSGYYAVMLGRTVSDIRAKIAKEEQDKEDSKDKETIKSK